MSKSVITVFVVVVLVVVVVPHFSILYSVYSKEQIQNISNEFRPQYKSKSIKTTIKTYVLKSNENLNKIIVTLVTRGLPSSSSPPVLSSLLLGVVASVCTGIKSNYKNIKTTHKVLEPNENLNKIIVTLVTQGLPSSFLPSCFKFTIVGSCSPGCCVRLHGA